MSPFKVETVSLLTTLFDSLTVSIIPSIQAKILTLQQTTFIVSSIECDIFCYLRQEIC
jgi:hypothetical protein